MNTTGKFDPKQEAHVRYLLNLYRAGKLEKEEVFSVLRGVGLTVRAANGLQRRMSLVRQRKMDVEEVWKFYNYAVDKDLS